MIKNILRVLLLIFLGGVLCWAPDVVLHLCGANEFSGRDVVLVSFLMPGVPLASYAIIIRVLGHRERTPSIAFFMMVGSWLLGSFAMMIITSASVEEFFTSDTWGLILLGLLPPYTFIMATYDGSLLGLMLAPPLMLMMHFAFERGHWILPVEITRLSDRSTV